MGEPLTSRCPTCNAPSVLTEDRTRIAHLSWCRWSPRARAPIVVLPVPAYLEDEADDE